MLKVINKTSIPLTIIEGLVDYIVRDPHVNPTLTERLILNNVELTLVDYRRNNSVNVNYRKKRRVIQIRVFDLSENQAGFETAILELTYNILHETLEASGLSHRMMAKLGRDYTQFYRKNAHRLNEPESCIPDWLEIVNDKFAESLKTGKSLSKLYSVERGD